MRAFSKAQQQVFLDAFGEPIQTSTGITFTGIVEVIPVSIEAAGGFIEGEEHYVSTKIENITEYDLKVGTILIINAIEYVVYNIVDDHSGIVNIYYRTEQGQSFAENY